MLLSITKDRKISNRLNTTIKEIMEATKNFKKITLQIIITRKMIKEK